MTPSAPTTAFLQLTNRHIQYSVRKSLKARRVRIRVSSKGIEVVLPRRVALCEARGLLLKHASWVERQLSTQERLSSLRLEHQSLHPGTIMFRGSPIAVAVVEDPTTRQSGVVKLESGGIQLRVCDTSEVYSHRALEKWLRRIARLEIESRLAVRASEMNCTFNRVTIRSQHARWGSCSSLRNLSFNWRLIHAPAEVLDYVVVHELAHLTELNHSPRFWKIVAAHCPEFTGSKKWLRENASTLDIHRSLVEMEMASV